MVGNGNHLFCSSLYPAIPILIQNQTFEIVMYLLPIEAVDVVLGIQRLSSLGPITSIFLVPCMTFVHQKVPITIIGNKTILATFHQFKSLIRQDFIAFLHLISFFEQDLSPNPNPQSTPKPNLDFTIFPPEVQPLLQGFSPIFKEPQGLPLVRPHDHQIPLLPNSKLVNVKPYRYPHLQKEAMTKLSHKC